MLGRRSFNFEMQFLQLPFFVDVREDTGVKEDFTRMVVIIGVEFFCVFCACEVSISWFKSQSPDISLETLFTVS